MRGRIEAPLALRVRLFRTDVVDDRTPEERQKGMRPPGELFDVDWIVSSTSTALRLPPVGRALLGEGRLRLTITADPVVAGNAVVFFSDAAKASRAIRAAKAGIPDLYAGALRRTLASTSIYSAPLCGGWQLETVEEVGNCIRGYLTIPIVLGSVSATRMPGQESTLTEVRTLGLVGMALNIDSYDPVEQRAFPLALQLGVGYQQLTDYKRGVVSYLGLAPTLPVLGEGGVTTRVGLLAGGGMTYIFDDYGPNEGFKPSAFAGLMVQVGQLTVNGGAGSVGAAGTATP